MEFVSIPQAVSVRRVQAWDRRQDEGIFCIARLHLTCNNAYELKPETHLGERIAVSVAQNAQIKVVQTIKTSISVVDPGPRQSRERVRLGVIEGDPPLLG